MIQVAFDRSRKYIRPSKDHGGPPTVSILTTSHAHTRPRRSASLHEPPSRVAAHQTEHPHKTTDTTASGHGCNSQNSEQYRSIRSRTKLYEEYADCNRYVPILDAGSCATLEIADHESSADNVKANECRTPLLEEYLK
ncbi:hypothetical protein EVAR_17079_1 [Eumeta japonica]|uniref:Uncharacterized protein n=1 Tax=Eumeta variegata TaxID=151549 RepID=A0A4C1V4N8_EUMVA|nr:hypothetical protein EVAR_17079_1 [Eumeta japonica]